MTRQPVHNSTDIEDARCSCRYKLGPAAGDELDQLEDLILHGFDQPTASRLMWVWTRRQIAYRVRKGRI